MGVQENIIETKEFVYEYQPKDKFDRPIGGLQIFKGATVQEVLDKVADANKNLVQLNRDLTRRVRLGEFEKDELPNDVAKVKNNNLLQPRELTLEEKAQFARDILDPEKFDEVNARLIEAQLGAKPEAIRSKINNQEQRLSNIEARQEAEFFAMSNPEYFMCDENFRMITNWMVKNDLSPVRENFQLAYDTLKAEDLIIKAPVVEDKSVNNTPPPPVIPPVPNPAPPVITPPVEIHAPSGLTRSAASDQGTPVVRVEFTLKDVDKMSSEDYKRKLLTDKTFAAKVDALYAEQAAKKRGQ
jgi:hypothetical protein